MSITAFDTLKFGLCLTSAESCYNSVLWDVLRDVVTHILLLLGAAEPVCEPVASVNVSQQQFGSAVQDALLKQLPHLLEVLPLELASLLVSLVSPLCGVSDDCTVILAQTSMRVLAGEVHQAWHQRQQQRCSVKAEPAADGCPGGQHSSEGVSAWKRRRAHFGWGAINTPGQQTASLQAQSSSAAHAGGVEKITNWPSDAAGGQQPTMDAPAPDHNHCTSLQHGTASNGSTQASLYEVLHQIAGHTKQAMPVSPAEKLVAACVATVLRFGRAPTHPQHTSTVTSAMRAWMTESTPPLLQLLLSVGYVGKADTCKHASGQSGWADAANFGNQSGQSPLQCSCSLKPSCSLQGLWQQVLLQHMQHVCGSSHIQTATQQTPTVPFYSGQPAVQSQTSTDTLQQTVAAVPPACSSCTSSIANAVCIGGEGLQRDLQVQPLHLLLTQLLGTLMQQPQSSQMAAQHSPGLIRQPAAAAAAPFVAPGINQQRLFKLLADILLAACHTPAWQPLATLSSSTPSGAATTACQDSVAVLAQQLLSCQSFSILMNAMLTQPVVGVLILLSAAQRVGQAACSQCQYKTPNLAAQHQVVGPSAAAEVAQVAATSNAGSGHPSPVASSCRVCSALVGLQYAYKELAIERASATSSGATAASGWLQQYADELLQPCLLQLAEHQQRVEMELAARLLHHHQCRQQQQAADTAVQDHAVQADGLVSNKNKRLLAAGHDRFYVMQCTPPAAVDATAAGADDAGAVGQQHDALWAALPAWLLQRATLTLPATVKLCESLQQQLLAHAATGTQPRHVAESMEHWQAVAGLLDWIKDSIETLLSAKAQHNGIQPSGIRQQQRLLVQLGTLSAKLFRLCLQVGTT